MFTFAMFVWPSRSTIDSPLHLVDCSVSLTYPLTPRCTLTARPKHLNSVGRQRSVSERRWQRHHQRGSKQNAVAYPGVQEAADGSITKENDLPGGVKEGEVVAEYIPRHLTVP